MKLFDWWQCKTGKKCGMKEILIKISERELICNFNQESEFTYNLTGILTKTFFNNRLRHLISSEFFYPLALKFDLRKYFVEF